MEQLYYTPSLADSFGSLSGLRRHTKNVKGVRDFLMRQDAYTLHRDVKRRFQRRKTLALSVNDLWQADLVELSSISRDNDGFRYLLICVDVLSKYARVVMIKTKTASVVTAAFATMLKDCKPRLLQTDKGTEFLNSTFQQLLKDDDIKHYTTENDYVKCAVVERWHRTILTKLYRYFTFTSTTRYVDVIQDLVQSYNDTVHSTIKVALTSVNEHNESDIRRRLYSKPITKAKAKFKVGDTVRISSARRIFVKGYRDKWSQEVFIVSNIHNTIPITYGLVDYADEDIKGKFYAEELQKVVKQVFKIEKVLRTRKKAGKIEYYVKWVGYPDKFNSWTDHINA